MTMPMPNARVAAIEFSWRQGLLFTLLLGLLTLSPVAVTATLAALAIWALLGPLQALQALILAMVVKHLSTGLVQFSGDTGLLTWLVPLAAGLRVVAMIRARDLRILGALWTFALCAGALSVRSSPAVMISIMKVLTFTWVISTVVIGYGALTREQLDALVPWLLTLLLVVVGLSLLTLARPQLAYLKNGVALQGILNHPQALGVLVSPLATLLLARFALMRAGTQPVLIGALAVTWSVMFLTGARTAALAALSGVAFAFLTRVLRQQRGTAQAGTGRIVAVAFLGVIVITVAALSGAGESFLLKRSGTDNLGDAFSQSRGSAIEDQWRRFLSAPWQGHGFGVYPNGEFPAGVTTVAGIPISAPVEKGFVPTAILEETGIIGASLFALLLWLCGREVWRNEDLSWIAVFVACLFINIGEAVILSPGGIGLYIWMLIMLAVSKGRQSSASAMSAPDEVPRNLAANHPISNLMT